MRTLDQHENNSFEAQCLALGTLETFDPVAFQGDEVVPQPVCNFVLALALVFNDLKDSFYAHIILQGYKPVGTLRTRTKAVGLYAGMDVHLLRLIMGTVHELLNLIREQEMVLQDPTFLKTVRSLPKEARDAWSEIENVALRENGRTKLGHQLLLIRNKVAFHYDPKVIRSGYQRHFFSSEKEDNRAYISRGEDMEGTRFYFADAAAYGVLITQARGRPEDMAKNLKETIESVSLSLRSIVAGFIQNRRCAYRSESES